MMKKLGYFDFNTNEWILLGYFSRYGAYKWCNLSLSNMVENLDVKVDETMNKKEPKRSLVIDEDDHPIVEHQDE